MRPMYSCTFCEAGGQLVTGLLAYCSPSITPGEAKENLDTVAEAGPRSISINLTQLHKVNGVSYLHHFTLWAFREDQDLVVERIQRLPHGLGLFLGHADAVLQEVNFNVGR